MPYPTKKLWEIWIFNRWVTYNKWDLLENYQKWCVTLLRANNINDWLYLNDFQYLPWGFVKNDKILKENDIIFCMSSWSKHLVWKNTIIPILDNYSFWVFCSMFRMNTENEINYISYFLKSDYYKNYIFNFSQGVNILNLKNTDLEEMSIPLPPLLTQKLIVQKLDSSFEKIDKSIELTKKNLENIEELNKSVLEEVFREWKYNKKMLWEISDIINWWTPDTQKEIYWDWDIFWITPKDMWKLNWVYVNNTIRKISSEWLKNSSAKVFPINSIILSSRAPIWYLAINTVPMATNQWCKAIVPSDILDAKFLYYFLSISVKLLNDLWSWTTFKELSSWKLKEVELPLPPLSKQKEIVAQLDKVFEKNKALKQSYEKKLKDLEEMKQSLLKEAFEWRLVKE